MANRTALARATESTDAPTPGYLYVDIAKNAASSPVASREVVTYLTRRLQNKNHNVKFKSLKLLAKTATAQQTRGVFKRDVCQDPAAVMAVKDCLNFRGPPDPLRGDEIYERVRAAAKECLDAIYSDTPSSDDAVGMGAGGRTASYGNSPYGASSSSSGPYGGAPGGGGGGGGGGGRMEGIGNPMFQDPRLAQGGKGIKEMTMGEVANTAVETVKGMIKDPLARNAPAGNGHMPTPNSGMPGYGGGGGGSRGGSYAYPPGRNELASATGGQWTMASNRGPNAVTGSGAYDGGRDAYYKSQQTAGSYDWAKGPANGGGGGAVPAASPPRGGVGGSWGPPGGPSVASQARVPPDTTAGGGRPASFAAPQGANNYGGTAGTAASDGTFERNLIQELCPPGGMKAEPPAEKLADYSRSVPSLNPDLVCPALLDALEDGQPWIVRAKALCVIETTLRVTSARAEENAFADFFHACVAEIEPLASHSRAAVREPAARVLKMLGVESAGGEAAPTAAASARKATRAASAAAAPNPAAPPAEPAADLLDFGGADDAPAPAPAPPAEAPPRAPAPAASAGEAPASLFGGLTVQQKPAAPPAPVPAPAAAPPSNLLDGSPNQDNAAAGGLFGDVSVKANGVAPGGEAPAKPAEAATPASGFSFIAKGGDGAEARDGPPEKSPDSQGGGGAPAPSSDPLLSMDWSGNAPAAASNAQTQQQINAAQMSAMAASYQQNMAMMQQMQMRQMMMQQQAGAASQGAIIGSPPSKQNVMKANSMRQIPLMQAAGAGGGAGAMGVGSFSFLQDDSVNKKKQQEQKKFDFVQDAMKSAK